jgi:hypothetical protein
MKNIANILSCRVLFLVVLLAIPTIVFAQGLTQEEPFAKAKGILVTDVAPLRAFP